MESISIVNLKCGGCANTISKALEQEGFTQIHVDVENSKVSFEGDKELAKKILAKKGYPQAGSPEANSLLKNMQSYVSCMKGKFS